MAASSASADCIKTARDLTLPEVLGWFSDQEKQRAVCKKFMAARHAAMSHSEAWAKTNWTETCETMRQVMGMNPDSGFALICDLLDSTVQPVQEPPQRKKAEAVSDETRKRKRLSDNVGRGPVVAVPAMPHSSDMTFARKERKLNPDFEARLNLFRQYLLDQLAPVTSMKIRQINKKFKGLPQSGLTKIRNMGALWKHIHNVSAAVACSTNGEAGHDIIEKGKQYTYAGSVPLYDKTLCLYRDSSGKDEKDLSDFGPDSDEDEERPENEKRAVNDAVSAADASIDAAKEAAAPTPVAEATACLEQVVNETAVLNSGSPEVLCGEMPLQLEPFWHSDASNDSGVFKILSNSNEKQAIENAAAPAVTGMGGGEELEASSHSQAFRQETCKEDTAGFGSAAAAAEFATGGTASAPPTPPPPPPDSAAAEPRPVTTSISKLAEEQPRQLEALASTLRALKTGELPSACADGLGEPFAASVDEPRRDSCLEPRAFAFPVGAAAVAGSVTGDGDKSATRNPPSLPAGSLHTAANAEAPVTTAAAVMDVKGGEEMEIVSPNNLESKNARGGLLDVDTPSAVEPDGKGVHLEERKMLDEGGRSMEQEASAEISTVTVGEGPALRHDTAAPSGTTMGPEHEQGTGCCICSDQSAVQRTCPTCNSRICGSCAGFSIGLFEAALPFLSKNQPQAWNKLGCLNCKGVESQDAILKSSFEVVAEAVKTSLSSTKFKGDEQRTLWYEVGKTISDARASGVEPPDILVTAALDMLNHELKMKGRRKDQLPSVSPWDGMVFGLSASLILELSKAYARRKPLKPTGRLRELDGEFVIAFISADLVDHSTMHLVAADLMEMSKLAKLKVLCVAKPERVGSMNPISPYRHAIMECCGENFLEVGHLSDQEIAQKLTAANPHIILHTGCHQDADRVNVLLGGLRALAVQYVGHAGTTGYSRFDYILGSKTTLPEENKHHFTETRLLMDAPFHGNSFRQFFKHAVDGLHVLRTDPEVRSKVREDKYFLKRDCQILLNISYPNRLDSRFWSIIFRVLKENPRAVLVLVDHVKAFRRRWLARFESRGLGGRLLFVPYQELHDGSLHSLMAVSEVYVDAPGYGGHTAMQDALFACRVVISFGGNSLPELVGADLLIAFGTPENLCDNDDTAVNLINKYLQNGVFYQAACLKSDRCRTESSMYDNELRARNVIAALKEGYICKLKKQKQLENDGSDTLSSDDLENIAGLLGALQINIEGPFECDAHSWTAPASFRGASVLALLPRRTGDGPRENIIFREILGRGGIASAYGPQAWTRALPLNERDVTEQGDTRLDVISLNYRSHPLHAVLLERPTSNAATLFEPLALEWKACEGLPMDRLLDRTIIALQALLKLLAFVHGSERSFGGDPLEHLHLSPLKDGHFKTAVATIERSDGTPCAIMLGRASHMLIPNSTDFHGPGCKRDKNGCLPVARKNRQRNEGGLASRFSGRTVSKSASFSFSEIEAQLSDLPEQPPPRDGGTLPCCGCYPCVESAQRDDLRRAAQVIMNVLVGQSKTPTVVMRIGGSGAGWGEQCTGAELYAIFLRGLGTNAFCLATGLSTFPSDDSSLITILREKNKKFALLLDLLAKILGRNPLQAGLLLADQLFREIVVPSNALPEGLESAPEDRRARLRECEPLMKALTAHSQHYFVKGNKKFKWGRGASTEEKVLIDVWLVYTRNPDKDNKVFRSVRAAEPGHVGNLAAIYAKRLERDPGNGSWLDITYVLKIPNMGECPLIDGKDRDVLDAQNRVESSDVGMYLNSTKDEQNMNAKPCNCTRLWDPEWKTLGSSKSPSTVPDDIRMGLVLNKEVNMYDELMYRYDWYKTENESNRGKKHREILDTFARSGGGS